MKSMLHDIVEQIRGRIVQNMIQAWNLAWTFSKGISSILSDEPSKKFKIAPMGGHFLNGLTSDPAENELLHESACILLIWMISVSILIFSGMQKLIGYMKFRCDADFLQNIVFYLCIHVYKWQLLCLYVCRSTPPKLLNTFHSNLACYLLMPRNRF